MKKSKVNTITTIVLGLIIFSLAKYYTKGLKATKKEPIKASTVETNTIIDKKEKPIVIPSARAYDSVPQQNYLGIGCKINSKR
jgi:ABC-type uncharacterized transport system permease subunit